MSKLKENQRMTEKQVHSFEKIQIQLENLYQEISTLSKKKQDDGLNSFKLKLVNKTLEESNSILGDKYKPFDDFIKFDDDDIPTNSDVALVLGQYLGCMEKLRNDNIQSIGGPRYWYWILEENKKNDPRDDKFIRIRTKEPENF